MSVPSHAPWWSRSVLRPARAALRSVDDVHDKDRAEDALAVPAQRTDGHVDLHEAAATINGGEASPPCGLRLAAQLRPHQGMQGFHRQADVEVLECGADRLVLTDAPEVGGLMVPGDDAQVPVDDGHTRTQPGEDGLGEVVEL